MQGKIDFAALQSLLPQAVIDFALAQEDLTPPLQQSFSTVAMFADVSGFTKLSEHFANKGPQGAEELAFFLNRYMEQLVRHIARAGGDIFKFAGDAMLALWVPPKDLTEDELQTHLHEMAHRAIQCSIAIQNEMNEAELTAGVTLSVKIGIGVGNATVLHVGGVYSRVEYFACGLPLMQAFLSEAKASSGDIIVSPSVWKYVKDSFDGEIVLDNFVRITKQTQSIRNKSVKARGRNNNNFGISDYKKLLERYIPAAVLPYLTRYQHSWTGELRLVTVLFINIGVNLSSVQNIDAISLDWIQTVITFIQKAIYKYEGSLNKFLVDDKGSNVIAVFGVPPLAHYDDATRGLLAALKLLKEMHGLGIKCFIGVTSGLVFTGLLGSQTSREYGVLGDAVNLAARLMGKQKKSKIAGIICDKTTLDLIPSDAPIKFEQLEPFYVKGKSNRITAFYPKFNESFVAYIPQYHYYDVGRENIIKILVSRMQINSKRKESLTVVNLDDINSISNDMTLNMNMSAGVVLLIESPIGTGKTYFLESLCAMITARTKTEHNDWKLIWASGQNYMQKAHMIWSKIFSKLLSKTEFTENRSYRQHVKSLFESEDKYRSLIPYLSLTNDIFGTQFLETERCSLLAEENRWDKKTECCLSILEQFSSTSDNSPASKLILFIDNLQWSQEDDWKITEFVCNMICCTSNRQLKNVYLFFATCPILSPLFRPRFEEPPAQYGRIRHQLKNRKQLLVLPSWNLIEVTIFMCEYFACDDLHPCLPMCVYERSGGNPSFVTWICELIEVQVTHIDGVMLLAMSEITERNITSVKPLQYPVPMKVHSTLMGYIDRLSPSQVLLLKTASVICMGQGSGSVLFDLQAVTDCYPMQENLSSLTSDIRHLIEIGIIDQIDILNYDVFGPCPNIFIHNFAWMHQSIFMKATFDIAECLVENDSNSNVNGMGVNIIDSSASSNTTVSNSAQIWTTKLVHFFIGRLIFYQFSDENGVNWRLKTIIPFNHRTKAIRLRRKSKEILVIEYDGHAYQMKGKYETMNDWHSALDDCLNGGLMTEDQEKELTYPIETNTYNKYFKFQCGFFRDVIYGLMLLKQRQQLHEIAVRILKERWTSKKNELKEEDEKKEGLSIVIERNDSNIDSIEIFSQFRENILSRHRDLALKDHTLRRMGSFYQAAPQAKSNSQKSNRLHTITSIYKSFNGKNKHRVATLASPTNFQGKKSIFAKLRQSLSPTRKATITAGIHRNIKKSVLL